MLESLLISQGLLWIVVIILAVACLALARQVGVLYERIAPVGALSINQRLSAGDNAPTLQVKTLAGQLLDIAQPVEQSKSQLLFFLSPSCPICKTLLPVLHRIKHAEKTWLNIILASDGDNESAHRTFIKKQSLEDYPYVLSESLGMAYAVSKLPYGVLIDEKGKITALGLVNSREHLESLLEAKTLGVATIQDYLQNQAEKTEDALTSTHPIRSAP